MKCRKSKGVWALPQKPSAEDLPTALLASRQTHTSHAMWVPTVYFAYPFIPRLLRFPPTSLGALCRRNVSTRGESLCKCEMLSFEFLTMLLFLRHNQNFMARPPILHTHTYTYTRSRAHEVTATKLCIVNARTKHIFACSLHFSNANG